MDQAEKNAAGASPDLRLLATSPDVELRARLHALLTSATGSATSGCSSCRGGREGEPNKGSSMRLAAWSSFIVAALVSVPVHAQNPEDELRVYSVGVINIAPFKNPFSGYGVYLGQGVVITAAHVVGHWALFTSPRILIAGQELPAKVIKKGSFEQTDLALLSVDEASLPVSLRLRRNPLCKTTPSVGTEVVVVYPERTIRSRIVSPQTIAPQYRSRFNTLISDPQGSGSGVFHAERKCFLGIMSASVESYHRGHTGYFVPASKIADFIPAEFRF